MTWHGGNANSVLGGSSYGRPHTSSGRSQKSSNITAIGRGNKKQHFVRPTGEIPEITERTEPCHQCGSPLTPDCVFCRKCGTRRRPDDANEELSECETNRPGPSERRPSVVTSEQEFFSIRDHFDCPTASSLTLMQVGMSLGYSAYMMTSWTYVTMRINETFPVCSHEWPYSWEMRFFCNCSILSFWCCPLLCCILLVVFFYRELLHTRLYYVMLTHRVLLDFTNESFWDARPVRWMIVFLVVGLLSYPLGNNMSFEAIKLTLPYWIPVLSFSGMIYGYWDLESRLLSLSKFVEDDVTFAKRHLAKCYFIRDYVAEAAYWILDAKIRNDKEEPWLTGKYIEKLVEVCEALEGQQELEELEHARAASDTQLNVQQWHPKYWVSDFLWTECIVDARGFSEKPREDFRRWFRVYFCYSCLILFILLYFLISTVVTHLHHQEIITGSIWTEMFKFKNAVNEIQSQSVQPVAHSAPPIVHMTSGLVHF